MAKRFFVAAQDIHGKEAILRGKEAHHATRVMRFSMGDQITVFDGEGFEYQGTIQQIRNDQIILSIEGKSKKPQTGVSITIACALPRQTRMERIIEKLTEVGVEAIIPISTDRTVPKLKGKEEVRGARWKRIAMEAAKQCGASQLPDIGNISSLQEVLSQGGAYDLSLFLTPQEKVIQACLKDCSAKRVIVLIGPEGGWSEKEASEAKEAGWTLASLGNAILKIDTACLSITSILHYVLDPKVGNTKK